MRFSCMHDGKKLLAKKPMPCEWSPMEKAEFTEAVVEIFPAWEDFAVDLTPEITVMASEIDLRLVEGCA